MSEDMVERVARAIIGKVEGYTEPWDYYTDGEKESALRVARAAIEAMREPTEAMTDAVRAALAFTEDPVPSPEASWSLMIDAALTQRGSEE